MRSSRRISATSSRRWCRANRLRGACAPVLRAGNSRTERILVGAAEAAMLRIDRDHARLQSLPANGIIHIWPLEYQILEILKAVRARLPIARSVRGKRLIKHLGKDTVECRELRGQRNKNQTCPQYLERPIERHLLMRLQKVLFWKSLRRTQHYVADEIVEL